MLDPEILVALAAHPERNAPDVNLALAEQGDAAVLLSLARSAHTGSTALAVVGSRMEEAVAEYVPEFDDGDCDDDERLDEAREEMLLEFDRVLVENPAAPDDVRDAVLERHPAEPFFVLAAAVHVRATPRALEQAARWPCRFVVWERPWLGLVSRAAVPPLVAEAWAQDTDAHLRAAAACLATDARVLAALAADERREVRRALAANAAARPLPSALVADRAPEVRARAAAPAGDDVRRAVPLDSPRFEGAVRAMHSHGELAPEVAAALGELEGLDPEGAMLAARVLPAGRLLGLVDRALAARADGTTRDGLAAGLALRAPYDDAEREELRLLVGELAKTLSVLPYGALTGKARLAAWAAEGLGRHLTAAFAPDGARNHLARELLDAIRRGALASDPAILARASAACPTLLRELFAAGAPVPAAAVELAWRDPSFPNVELLALTGRLAPTPRRGEDLPEDEFDLELGARPMEVLERIVLAVNRVAPLSARLALTIVALDARRVRFVMTALPQWRGRLTGAELGRVLRQHAGALGASRPEARPRGSEVKQWTERLMTDAEVAVALGVGHLTAEELTRRLRVGRHRIGDAVNIAAGADARAIIEGPESIAPLTRWAAQHRAANAVALALWLLLEAHDGTRTPQALAAAVDGLAVDAATPLGGVSEALAVLERRRPGRLDLVAPQSPRGKATLASAIARAYRATGGLRDERA